MKISSTIMSPRLNLLTEPAFESLNPTLLARMSQLGDSIHAPQFEPLLEPLLRQVIEQGFREAGAHEGTVWLADAAGEFLEPAFNTGPRAGQIVGRFKQPLGSGLISMVFATEQPFVENDVPRNAQQSKLLDVTLGVQTHALIAVPFHFLKACRGVVSCVQLKPADSRSADPPGFLPQHVAGLQRTTALAAMLIEYRLLSRMVGWVRE
jgi:transcriptional regulator with GAF, ATPase, and Fis domain